MSENAKFKLSIVIVTWNVSDLLSACLRSIEDTRGALSMEVIVVDSHSEDDTVAMVSRNFPEARLVSCTENVGFARGNNLGIALARGHYLALLNPDTEVREGALQHMIDYLDAHEHVGTVGPQLLNPDGSIQSSRRRFPGLLTAMFESTWLQPLAPSRLIDRYYFNDLDDQATSRVDWLTGACLMTRREVIDQVGVLDEAYFMYSEELDWCKRVHDAGWEVVYLPDAQVMHHRGKSSEQAVTQRHINFQRAKLRYFRKHHGAGAALYLRLMLLANYAWQLVVEALKALIGHRRELRQQRVRAYWQVLMSGLRPAGY